MSQRRGVSVFCGVLAIVALIMVVVFNPVSARPITAQVASPISSPAGDATPVPVRRVLATGQSPLVPDQTLNLVRYDIPAGMVLPVHIHPGVQIAWVAAGELTYHVLKGEVQIGRAASASASGPGTPEVVGAGETTTLLPGDWVIEVDGAVHYGENLGTEVVVLWATTLLPTGDPASIPVNAEGTPVAQ
jgi:quercetin dioxygenase-like cupin family protein